MAILTLLTDFGLADFYVGAVKGTVLARAPGATLVDLSHQVPPGDVELAAFLLWAAAPAFPAATVHLAVVDPGVGSSRRIVLAEAQDQLFLTPDNGLLTPFLPKAKVRAVERPDLYLFGSGNTFHGRDRFAPVAAALLIGAPPASMGPEITDAIRLDWEPPQRESGRLSGRVLHVDRFGNLVTDLPSDWLPPGGSWVMRIAGREVRCRADHYLDLAPGKPAVLPGSLGTLELALNRASLANTWGVTRGTPVTVLID